MDNKINYLKVKRDLIGKCNICGDFGKLTWDHVPPKKSIFFRDIEIVSIFGKYSLEGYPKIHSQNGNKYRTICEKCNNILGTAYDVDFIYFINQASNNVYINFDKQEEITCKIKPVKVIKSLFGHLLAAKGDYEESLIDIKMRGYVLNKDMLLPPLNVFYWFYPFPNIDIVRDLAIAKLDNKESFDIFSMIKMYPVAFIITENDKFYNFKNLKDYCIDDAECYVDIPLDISRKNLINSDWPIIVDDNTIFLAGKSIDSSVTSSPRKIKIKK
ncbi:hypothetical protein [Clostridium cadaveris]|uniref:hypothetical protein n=1 Tax=Clostridium cadaveris TaxID=1529 RepID=UPI000C072E89|nr:hypothetical protein [Clostridium cadaveris]MDM8313609.1 hypothetical protein [Clostridium cadaveris]